jgi:putative endonuclease
MRDRQPCTDILTNRYNGTFYTGATSNLVGRMIQHRQGTFDGFTKQHGINRLVYFEVADTMEAAISREKQVKRYKRGWKRNLIERDNPWWHDLAVGVGLEPLSAPLGGDAGPGTGLS